MDLRVNGKVAMVAGASRGLGFSVAKMLVAEGATVCIASRDRQAIDAAAGKLRALKRGTVVASVADVSKPGAIEAWAKEIDQQAGGIDMLFTNSGGPPAGMAMDITDEGWQSAFDLLLLSAIRMVRVAVPSMQARGGGSILMCTSSSVKEPLVNLALSNVMRAGVSALAKTLSQELAKDRIRVNQLMPGRIDTDRLRQLDEVNATRAGITPDEQKQKTIGAIPVGRYGNADEFGCAAAFLLSDCASYITGASLQVDGGLIRSVL